MMKNYKNSINNMLEDLNEKELERVYKLTFYLWKSSEKKIQESSEPNEKKIFTEEELKKVPEKEREHLLECEKDYSKIDMWYFEIMKKYNLFEEK